MKKIMFLGMGGIGSSFASQLKDSNINPLVICNKERKLRYEKDGFIVNNKRYDFEYITPDTKNYTANLIIISVKYNDLNSSLDELINFVGENTLIMSLMNGIDSELIIAEKFSMDKIIHSFVIAIDAVREKNNVVYSNPGKIIFGNQNGLEDYKTDFIKNILDTTTIQYKISDNILKELWWKFMVNVGINQTSAILNAPYSVFQQNQDALELMKLAMQEVIDLSIAMDINLEQNSIKKFQDILIELHKDGKTSMLQDVQAKRETEVDMLAGQVCKLGIEYNIETPINNVLFKMLKTIEYMNKKVQ